MEYDLVGEDLHRFKHGTLRSSSGRRVRKRSQALAIALSAARRAKGGRANRRSLTG